MTDTAHMIYAASVRQIAGLEAERNALVLANAAKQEQVDGLLEERKTLRDQVAEMRGNLADMIEEDAQMSATFARVLVEVEASEKAHAAQVDGLLEECNDLRAWIIEASSAFRNDGGTDTLSEALGLVRLCHEGAAALGEVL